VRNETQKAAGARNDGEPEIAPQNKKLLEIVEIN